MFLTDLAGQRPALLPYGHNVSTGVDSYLYSATISTAHVDTFALLRDDAGHHQNYDTDL